MARINLFPWRDWRRRQRSQRVALGFVLGVIVAIAIVFWVSQMLTGAISDQNARNSFLRHEVAVLNDKLATIKALQKTRDALLARMKVIEQLEASRPTTVHLFDQLVRTLPNGLYLTKVKDSDGALTIEGVAESPAVVSTYMQNIAGSQWMKPPNLTVVRTETKGNEKDSKFTVTTGVVGPGSEGTQGTGASKK